MFYSKSTGGFYLESFHGCRKLTVVKPDWVHPTIQVPDPAWIEADHPDGVPVPMVEIADSNAMPEMVEVDNPDCKIPPDAKEISEDEYRALKNSLDIGKVIEEDSTGRLVAVDPAPLTDEELATVVRAQRDSMIAAVAWRYERHAREIRMGLKATDSLATLDTYIQELADITSQSGFPNDINWPEAP